MSFSSQMKEELARIPVESSCCRRAQLCGLMMSAGSIKLSAGGVQAELTTESPRVAANAVTLIKELYHAAAVLERHERRRLNRNYSYRVLVPGEKAHELLKDTGILSDLAISPAVVRKTCCRSAFLRGLFMGCGTVANPERSYQAEFVVGDEEKSKAVKQLLSKCGIQAKTVKRTEHFVVYMKYGEQITALMARIGAHVTLMDYENVRAMKDLRNNVNRAVNCVSANMSKLSNAAARQSMSIRKLMDAGVFDSIDEDLQLTARARLEQPEATLQELADYLGVSKSGVSHRLIRIEEISGELDDPEQPNQ
ncbi:MAG: DNA-binding protein WhiA [Eubacteriales bacterium]|nr:DNA-binding protein WhiA [Eubacteriales bacterium]